MMAVVFSRAIIKQQAGHCGASGQVAAGRSVQWGNVAMLAFYWELQ